MWSRFCAIVLYWQVKFYLVISELEPDWRHSQPEVGSGVVTSGSDFLHTAGKENWYSYYKASNWVMEGIYTDNIYISKCKTILLTKVSYYFVHRGLCSSSPRTAYHQNFSHPVLGSVENDSTQLFRLDTFPPHPAAYWYFHSKFQVKNTYF